MRHTDRKAVVSNLHEKRCEHHAENVLVRGAIKLQPSSYGQRADKQNSLVMKAQEERRSESTEQRRACGNLSVKTEVVVRCLEKVAEAC